MTSSSSGMPDQTDESCAELAHSDKPGWLIRFYHEGINSSQAKGYDVSSFCTECKSSFQYSLKRIFRNKKLNIRC